MIRTIPQEGQLSTQLDARSKAYQHFSRVLNKVPYLPSKRQYNLSISNSHKFVWYRVAKVGTRTIFDLFNQANVTLDAEHAMFSYYPSRSYREYFKFAFVRNPWERLVSCWRNKVVDANYFDFSQERLVHMQSFANFVDFVEGLNIETSDQHIRPQSSLIDLNEINFLGRFENFHHDLSQVAEKVGIDPANIGHYNLSSKDRSDYREYYLDDLAERVAERYSKDIQLLNYAF